MSAPNRTLEAAVQTLRSLLTLRSRAPQRKDATSSTSLRRIWNLRF